MVRRSVRRPTIASARTPAHIAGFVCGRTKIHRRQVEGFVWIGTPRHGGLPARGGHSDDGMVKRGATAQRNLTALGVGREHQPASIREQMKRWTVGNPPPRLAVV